MNLEPRNRHLLVAECEDPATKGAIIVEKPVGMGTCVVLAIDTTPYTGENPPPTVAEVGNIVYLRPESVYPVTLDNNQQGGMVHESAVLGVVRDIPATRKGVLKVQPLILPKH